MIQKNTKEFVMSQAQTKIPRDKMEMMKVEKTKIQSDDAKKGGK